MSEIHVKLTKTLVWGAFGTLLFGVGTYFSISTFFVADTTINFVSFLIPAIFLFFLGMSVLLILVSKRAVFSEEEVTVETFWGTYQLKLAEIRYMEEGSGNMILGNDVARLSLPSFEHWDKAALKAFFPVYAEVLRSKGIELKTTLRAVWPAYRICRVRGQAIRRTP